MVIWLLVAGTQVAPAIPRLTVGTQRGFPGNTVEVPITLRFGSNDLRNVVALQADLIFAPSEASPGAMAGGSALRGHVLAGSSPSTGTRRILTYALNNAVLSNGVVATLPFTVAAGIRSNVRIELSNVILSTADGFSVPVTSVGGAIVVSPLYVRPTDGNVEGYMEGLDDDRSYVVQATSNLVNWVNIATNAPVDSFLDFMDLDAHLFPRRFYRALPMGGVLGSVASLDGMQFTYRLLGVTGRSYVIQASTNMQTWTDLTTNVAADGSVSLTNALNGTFPYRFFRLKSGP